MISQGKIQRGAILGLDGGGSVWAKSDDFNVRSASHSSVGWNLLAQDASVVDRSPTVK